MLNAGPETMLYIPIVTLCMQFILNQCQSVYEMYTLKDTSDLNTESINSMYEAILLVFWIFFSSFFSSGKDPAR